jgi:hypothetical protein
MDKNMKSWMDLIIVVTPVILSPIIAWLLSHTGLPSEEARMNYLLKRLDLISRLQQIQTELKDDRLKEMFDTELEMCKKQMAFHRHDMIVQEEDMGSEPKSWIGRFFLNSPSKTIKQRVFKGLFYFFFVTFIFGLSTPLLLSDQFKEDWRYALLGSFFYLLMALAFRAMAKPKETI